MGVQSSSNRDSINIGEEVNFDHFQILRAIGKGSFGKVCIVQKKDTKQMYAMKYMHKSQCVERDALKNVLREMEILTTLEHPFLVNLWFCFQDEEDLFMVSDLLLGGDLRYHISQDIKFSEDTIHLYAFELGLALDYLRTKHIIHRDIKPDNILLDEEGHAHITDFNIATVLEENQLATSMSGTKPYIAPEIFLAGVDECLGYSYPVDWWSLGVTLFEILARGRPFDIHSNTSVKDVKAIVHSPVHYPSAWSESTKHLIAQLLCTDPSRRLSNAVDLTRHESLLKFNMDTVLEKQIKPGFTPPRDHLNCDPTFELEEMIVEARPLHKKKKRLAKQRSLKQNASFDIQENDLEDQLADFRVYNRERELIRRALEKKENDWEAELIQAMNESTVTSCEVKPHLSFDNATSDSTHASSTLLNLPPSIILDQRRRSSCKLSVSPLSVQTRLAASPQRNKEVKPPNDTAANCNKPKKKILNRQQTLQRLPYINVNEIITVDSTLLEKSEKGSKLSETFNSFHIGETIEEESGKNENAQNDQSPMSLANVLIEIEKLKERSEKDEDDENSAICDTQNEKQNSTNEIDVPRIEVEDLEINVPVDELNSRDSKLDNLSKELEENERKDLNEFCNKTCYDACENTSEDTKSTEVYSNSNKEVCDDKNTTKNEYNYHELTRFTVTKSISRTDENKTRTPPTDKNTPSQLEHTIDKTVPTEHHVTLNEKEFTSISLKNKIETGDKINQPTEESHRKEIRTATENVTIVNITYNSSCKENMHADEKFLTHNDSLLKISAQIKTSINTNPEVSNGCSESKSVTKNQTEISKNPHDPSQLGPLALPNISVSHETSSTSNSKTPADPQKSPMKSPMDRSPNRSPCRSPKLGDIPTRSVLKNSLYRTDSTDSTKSMEKSPKKSFKVSFSCDVEDNEARPKSPSAAKMAANSKSLDNDANEPSPSKKDKKKKKEN